MSDGEKSVAKSVSITSHANSVDDKTERTRLILNLRANRDEESGENEPQFLCKHAADYRNPCKESGRVRRRLAPPETVRAFAQNDSVSK